MVAAIVVVAIVCGFTLGIFFGFALAAPRYFEVVELKRKLNFFKANFPEYFSKDKTDGPYPRFDADSD